MKLRVPQSLSRVAYSAALLFCLPLSLLFSGCAGGPKNFGSSNPSPTVAITANPTTIGAGSSSTLTVTATNATQVTVKGTDGSAYTLQPGGGTQSVKPTATTTYTATATGAGGTISATATITIGSTAAPTVTIAANPTSVESGTSSTLTVAATNATAVTVSGSDGSTYTLQPSGGTQTVTPTATTTYTATATGAGGTVSGTATVTVGALPTVTILANPTSVASGGASTLTVAATNAEQVTVSGSDGSSYTLQPTGGTQSVNPTGTTTYTATATAGGTKVTAATTITVVAAVAPTVTISAAPASIAMGATSTLTVAATNATQVTVSGTDGSSYTLQPSGGTPSVSPTATTTYTATASGPGGKITAVTTVTVAPNPAPTVTLTADPTSVTAGASSILTVTATHATQVTLTGTDGSKYTLPGSGGTQAVSPANSTTYTATATGAAGTTAATATATLTVTANPPPTVTITADPTSVVSGGSSTLTVSATNADQVVITGSDGSTYTLASTSTTQTVTPTATTTYTATATGPGGTTASVPTATVTVTTNPPPTVGITANPTSIASGGSSTLTVTASNATQVTVTGTDGSTYNLPSSGGTQSVSPTADTTYTVTATGTGGNTTTASTSVTVTAPGSLQSITHVIFMMQENHSFDNYFGMLNPYRQSNSTNGQKWNVGDDGKTYNVDGIDDKLTTTTNKDDEGDVYPLFKFKTTCIDDDSSDWLASFGDVSTYNHTTTRPILMNGFVHTGEGFAKACARNGNCSGAFTDLTGKRAMGYYDQDLLNYYYYMASQFAVSDRWFSPVASKSVSNRIATETGGTTQGLVEDPGNDHLPGLNIDNIYQELTRAGVSWKIYYTTTQGFCPADDNCTGGSNAAYPATYFSHLTYAYGFLHGNTTGTCNPPLQPSSVVGDSTNSFCIDTNHIAPLSQYYIDLTNNTLPSFAFIEAGYGRYDEHPGSTDSILIGQAEVAQVINAFMASPEWKDSVFFFSYDEGGGPYDHVPPVPGHSNDYTNLTLLGTTPPDISPISVNPDQYPPCLPPNPPGTPTLHCDLKATESGASPGDAAYVAPGQDPTGTPQGFGSQLGFRLPNMIISPFTRRHFVSHVPMDHTAVIKFVENRFIGPSAHLTARDAAQPNLLDFFDFTNVPWATPPTPPTPTPNDPSLCTPADMGP